MSETHSQTLNSQTTSITVKATMKDVHDEIIATEIKEFNVPTTSVVHDIIVGGDGTDALRFHPSALTGVNVGDTIRWTWKGGFHNVVAGECIQDFLHIVCTASGKWWNVSDPPGGTSEIDHIFEWDVENDPSTGESPSGQTIHYYCEFHAEFGMDGSITVL